MKELYEEAMVHDQCSDDLLISSDRRLLQMDRVEALLRGTPWGWPCPAG